jgi:YD repeat-containing protein
LAALLGGLLGASEAHASDFKEQDSFMTISRLLAAALCGICPFPCFAHVASINGEAAYVSFSVPGATQGTFPMSINASMTVTGYFVASSTQTRGFLRDADGTITTFAIPGATLTLPESINAVGDVTGFYQLPKGLPQGFLRYAVGRVITFDLPGGIPTLDSPPGVFTLSAQPVSINDFDDIVGTYLFYERFNAFLRPVSGAYTGQISFGRDTAATAINDSGSMIGYATRLDGPTAYLGFVAHPDGYNATITVPLPPEQENGCESEAFPDGINATGMIAGWYFNSCYNTARAFSMSPNGVFTTFQPPGVLVASPVFSGTGPHSISIDDAGDITGSYTDAAGVQHGFVRDPYGTLTSFDPPEGKQTTATCISVGGAVAGWYQYNAGGGPPVGFIRVP